MRLLFKLVAVAVVMVLAMLLSSLGERRKSGDRDGPGKAGRESSPVGSVCAKCGEPMPPDSPSCPHCGHGLPA